MTEKRAITPKGKDSVAILNRTGKTRFKAGINSSTAIYTMVYCKNRCKLKIAVYLSGILFAVIIQPAAKTPVVSARCIPLRIIVSPFSALIGHNNEEKQRHTITAEI
jgi:hypothetical protein